MNSLPAQSDILARIKSRENEDMFGFEIGEYVQALEFESARPFLKEGATSEKWDEVRYKTREDVIHEIHRYMDFALEKAYGERGLSANRSIMHYLAWIWLAGDYEFLEQVQHEYDTNYHRYGLPILEMIIKHYGIMIKEDA